MAVPVGSTWIVKTDEEYIKAIEGSHGNVNLIARKLGLARTTVMTRLKNKPELMALVNAERDVFIDIAEDKLYHCVEQSSLPAIFFTLKTIGKARGWGESTELILSKQTQNEDEYDISVLTEEEREKLDELTAKIYKPKLIDEESSES